MESATISKKIEETAAEVVKIIRRYLPKNKYKIFLFGSWAKGKALETSDLDIGILGREKVPFETLIKIKAEAESILTLRGIDIVDLNTAEKSFRDAVLETGKIL